MLIAHNVPLCTHYMYKKEAEWGGKRRETRKHQEWTERGVMVV